MSVKHPGGRLLLALVSGAALSACSPSASTAVPPVEAAVPAAVLPVAAQAVATPPAAAAPVQPLVTGLPDFTRLVEAYGPAVVNVRIEAPPRSGTPRNPLLEIPGLPFQMEPRGGERIPRPGEGSGFIVSPDGYILTNAHVVSGSDTVIVRLADRRELQAKVVGTDERTDVAVLKVEARDLPTVRIGDPSQLKPGQWVVAIGSPFGMQNSVTAGIVSATSRNLENDVYVPFIQTDAAVNPGNSGGPLFNLQGEVVGINSQIYSGNGGYMGLSFAIPIDIADNVRNQLVSTGRVTRSILGVNINPTPMNAEGAEAWGLDRPRGALVEGVGEGSPAEQAGIRYGDIILSVDGKPVDSFSSLVNYISPLKPGTETTLEIWREEKLRKVTAKVVEDKQAEQPRAVPTRNGGNRQRGAEPPTTEQASEGLSVRPLTPEEKRLVETDGTLVVEEVSGPAAASNLQRGDIILDVAGTPVRSVAELRSLIKSAGRVVPLRIQRGENIGYQILRKQ